LRDVHADKALRELAELLADVLKRSVLTVPAGMEDLVSIGERDVGVDVSDPLQNDVEMTGSLFRAFVLDDIGMFQVAQQLNLRLQR
jgi:hypothetical protein